VFARDSKVLTQLEFGFNSTQYPGVSSLSITLSLRKNERVWGLGQTITNTLDNSGRCLDLAPSNGYCVRSWTGFCTSRMRLDSQ
jgi:hypothetical protein